MKHSSGPWKVVKSAYHENSQIWSDKVVNGDQKHIANVFTTCSPGINGHEVGRFSRIERDEQFANANLIAASPELFKALQSLTLSVSAHPDCVKGSEFFDLVSIAEKALIRAVGG